MSDKLFNKFQKVLELKLEVIKDEVHSAIENLKVEFESELDLILTQMQEEEKQENSFEVSYDDFIKIISKGTVTGLAGMRIEYEGHESTLHLNQNGIIRPPVSVFLPSDTFEIYMIELKLPSGKILDTKEVKELFVG